VSRHVHRENSENCPYRAPLIVFLNRLVHAGDASVAHTYASAHGHSLASTHANQPYPNESYLRGAMWLGRNFTILSEELAEEMSEFRTKFMAEVAVAGQDSVSSCVRYRHTRNSSNMAGVKVYYFKY
jgi:hypothetical protein